LVKKVVVKLYIGDKDR